jgi:DNA-directed RNA polymerase specialized sigma subunit
MKNNENANGCINESVIAINRSVKMKINEWHEINGENNGNEIEENQPKVSNQPASKILMYERKWRNENGIEEKCIEEIAYENINVSIEERNQC